MIQVHKSWLKFKILKWCLTSIGLFISSYIAVNYYQSQKRGIENSNFQKTERAIARLESRLKIYENLITQTQAFFVTFKNVNHENFNNYYRNLKNLSRFHAIQGLGFTRYVPQENLPSFLTEVRKEIPHFEIWPFEKKEEYFPVVYLQPQTKFSSSVIGFDQVTEPQREVAFSTAMLTGETVMSGKITFVRERGKPSNTTGFLLIRPLFHYQDHAPSLEKKNLIGFIFAPFLYQEFFKNSWVDFKDDFSFRVYESKDSKDVNLLYSSGEKQLDAQGMIESDILLFGQKLHIYFYPRKQNSEHLDTALLILAVGLSITFLVLKVLNDTIKRAEQSSINERYLEESLKSRDEFISIASHELKTPLTSLKLRAQISKRKLKLNNKVSEKDLNDFSTEIEKQVIRLERLVNDILDFSRIRTDNFSLSPEEFNFKTLVEEVVNRMGQQFTATSYPKMILPQEDQMVFWDKLRIEQVLINLLTNAIKYGKNAPITVEVQEKRNDIIFTVKDEGIGIASEFRETIFNRFERAGISPNEISGLGLGLYITYKIVTGHQGKIWVDSVLGEGSTFYIKIPKYPRF